MIGLICIENGECNMGTNEEVREMLETGYTVWQICQITKYDEEYVRKIEKDMEEGM